MYIIKTGNTFVKTFDNTYRTVEYTMDFFNAHKFKCFQSAELKAKQLGLAWFKIQLLRMYNR